MCYMKKCYMAFFHIAAYVPLPTEDNESVPTVQLLILYIQIKKYANNFDDINLEDQNGQ